MQHRPPWIRAPEKKYLTLSSIGILVRVEIMYSSSVEEYLWSEEPALWVVTALTFCCLIDRNLFAPLLNLSFLGWIWCGKYACTSMSTFLSIFLYIWKEALTQSRYEVWDVNSIYAFAKLYEQLLFLSELILVFLPFFFSFHLSSLSKLLETAH